MAFPNSRHTYDTVEVSGGRPQKIAALYFSSYLVCPRSFKLAAQRTAQELFKKTI